MYFSVDIDNKAVSSLARGKWIEAKLICHSCFCWAGLPSQEGSGLKRSKSLGEMRCFSSSLAKGSGLKRTNQGRRSLCPHTSSLVRGKNDYNVDNCKRKAPALSRDFVYYLKEEKPTASPPL